MANIAIAGDTSGSVTLQAPAIAGGTVVTLPTTSGTAALTSDLIGVGQTWQDVTASRAAGVTYTNNTGRPIQVMITVTVSTQTSNFSINGTVVATIANNGYIDYAPFSAIIPNGSTYSVSLGIFRWWELR